MHRFELIPPDLIGRLTDVQQERNIYAHPNVLARAIFWQRLTEGYRLLCQYAATDAKLLDFGGGSGAFLPTLAPRFREVSVIDLDLGDARRIAEHYGLNTVRLIETNIERWNSSEQYDVVTAMDVLEHFADKSVPYRFLEKHLKPGGLLLVSLPTENWLYRLGRIVVRKTKPVDHYHAAVDLVNYYRNGGYELLSRRHVPAIGPLALPLFYVGLFRKK